MESHAIIKFNNGNLAILCSSCRKIIKTGCDFTVKELAYAQGKLKKDLDPYYCEDCKNKQDAK